MKLNLCNYLCTRENCINVKRDAVILAWFNLNVLKSINNEEGRMIME